jgi:hypothetical protein
VSKIREEYNQKIDEVRNDYSSKVKELLDEIQKVRNVSTRGRGSEARFCRHLSNYWKK